MLGDAVLDRETVFSDAIDAIFESYRPFTQDEFDDTLRRWDKWVGHVVVYEGEIFVSKPFGGVARADMLPLIDAVSSFNRSLKVEFIINNEDWPKNSTPVPIFSFSRADSTNDVPYPHRYVVPEEICDAGVTKVPFAARNNSVFGRFSLFCGSVNGRALPSTFLDYRKRCQRAFFSDVKDAPVAWDVGPLGKTNHREPVHSPSITLSDVVDGKLVKKSIPSKPRVNMTSFGEHKYVLSTDGWVAGGKLSQLLATGSVVLKPQSMYRMYYEYFLSPNVHYVPLWQHGLHDYRPVLRDLAKDERRAAAIGASGRKLACELLTHKSRMVFWERLLQRFSTLMAYNFDETRLKGMRKFTHEGPWHLPIPLGTGPPLRWDELKPRAGEPCIGTNAYFDPESSSQSHCFSSSPNRAPPPAPLTSARKEEFPRSEPALSPVAAPGPTATSTLEPPRHSPPKDSHSHPQLHPHYVGGVPDWKKRGETPPPGINPREAVLHAMHAHAPHG